MSFMLCEIPNFDRMFGEITSNDIIAGNGRVLNAAISKIKIFLHFNKTGLQISLMGP